MSDCAISVGVRPDRPLPRVAVSAQVLSASVSLLLHAGFVAALLLIAGPAGNGAGDPTDVVEIELVAPEIATIAAAAPTPTAAAETPEAPAATEPEPSPTVAETAPEPPPEPQAAEPEPTAVAVSEPPPVETKPEEPPPVAEKIVEPTPEPEVVPPPPPPPVEVRPRPVEKPPVVERRPPPKQATKPVREAARPTARRVEKPAKTETAQATDATTTASTGPSVGSAGRPASGGTRDSLATYIASVRSRITAQHPRGIGLERGRVEVLFTVTADGRLDGVRVGRSFEDTLADEALRIVRRASPVPPIPQTVGRTSVAMSVTIEFK
jgi:protein TonB